MEDYLLAFASTNSAVKDYALECLATFGDGRGWEQVFEYLQKRLRRSHSTMYGGPSPTVASVDYLIRHGDGREKWDRLAKLLQLRWARLSEVDRQWLQSAWPEIGPSNETDPLATVPPPRLDKLIDWTAAALFSAPGIL
jgi:hypothetical protein